MDPEPEHPAAGQDDGPLGAGEADRILATWLSEYPDALYGVLGPNGIPTAVPPELGLPAAQVEPRSVLDLVIPEEAPAVTDAFTSALRHGLSVTSIHLVSDPGQTVLLHYLDLRDRYGIVLRVLVAGTAEDSAGQPLSPADLVTSRPRVCFMTKDEVSIILAVDAATTLMLGWEAADLVGRRSLEFIHPDDHLRAIDNWMARRSKSDAVRGTVRLRYLHQDGSWVWLETSNEFVTGPDGATLVQAQLIDISTEMAAGEALQRSEELLRRVTETVPVGLFHISSEGADGQVLFVNPVARRLLGDSVPGTRSELCTLLAGDRRDDLDAAIGLVLAEGVESYVDLEIGSEGDDPGSSCQVTLRPVMERDRPVGVLGCVIDVTELRHIAYTDPLTGLPNRTSILRTLGEDLASSDASVGAVYVDLDRFKPVNDLYGHAVGDQLLAAVAERLRNGIRPADRIGRLGGDEFLIVCPGLGSESEAQAMAERIRDVLEQPFVVAGRLLGLGASIGVSFGPAGTSADALVELADTAMYRVKHDQTDSPVLLPSQRQAG